MSYSTLCHSNIQKRTTGKMYYNVILTKSPATRQYEMWMMSPSAWSVKHVPLHVGRKKPMGEKNFLFLILLRIKSKSVGEPHHYTRQAKGLSTDSSHNRGNEIRTNKHTNKQTKLNRA